ncbi:MAG TPA: IPT/TIG domain-containing protein [Bacteroidales bacterium]|nr:IPT/TIG domain-containing protein [Bacteroidales bacterium]
MKKISAYISLLSVILFAIAVTFSACKKDTDGSPDISAGTPVLSTVAPTAGAGGAVVTVTGTGLGKIVSIVFENGSVPATFQPNLNTESAIIFRVPMLAEGGNQNIILTNIEGKTLSVPFDVLLPPAISSVWPTDFQAGSTVTITGNNLADVTDVVINGTTDAATIVSKTLTQLVITMPASEVNSGKLAITNLAGTTVTEQALVNIDKAVQVFTDDLMNGFQSWSWGGVYEPSTDYVVCGTKSMKTAFDAGGWGGLQMGNPGSIDVSGCRYFTFWAKGADVDFDVQVTINWGPWQSFTIPAGTWTYFKYDLNTAGWTGLAAVNNVTFQIKGADKTFYFDNIVFIKE